MSQFELSRLFSDHAVLCRDQEIRVFGKADPLTPITAALYDGADRLLARDQVLAEADGSFLLFLPPQPPQTGCVLKVSGANETVVCRDIAIGDVYLANGQSNMELELQNADEGRELLKTHANPNVRYYNVPKCPREGDEANAANRDARWRAISPGVGADMSAAAYFFAMKLQPEIGVPVGIIDCYWGGTSITCWLDEETLNETAEGQRYIRDYEEKSAGKTLEAYLQEEAAFHAETSAWDAAAAQLKEKQPDITPQELSEHLGPYPWHPPVGCGSPFRPFGLHRTMLRRVVPYTLTGVLFYQGEEDTWRTSRYDILLFSYLRLLRKLFRNDTLPFLNVQLPMWIDKGAADSKLWPPLRMAQQRVYLNARNTGLAVMLDQGEYNNIHPTNKRVVGERLYLEAREVVYHRPTERAVFATGKYRRGDALVVALTDEIQDQGGGEWLLEIAGADGNYLPAEARIEDRKLILSNPAVPRPVMARYAWTDYAKVRLFGKNGLPLAPFVFE